MTRVINTYSDVAFLEAAWSEYLHYGYFHSPDCSLVEAQEALLDYLLEPILPLSGTLIDLGCGPGASSRYLHNQYKINCLPVDEEMAMIQHVKRHSTPQSTMLGMVCAKAQHLPLSSTTVECVLCNEMLCHTEDKASAFEEIRRVLVPSGHLLITDVLPKEHNVDTGKFNSLLGHAQYSLQLAEYLALLESSRFSVLSVEDLSAHMFTSYVHAQKSFAENFHSLNQTFPLDKLTTVRELFDLALSPTIQDSIQWIAIRAKAHS